MDNGADSSPRKMANKKRKFSPIVWDRDDKGIKDVQRSRVILTTTSFPPQPARKSPTPMPVEVSPTPMPVEVSPTPMPVEASPTPIPVEASPTMMPVEVSPGRSDKPQEELEVEYSRSNNIVSRDQHFLSSKERQWGNGQEVEDEDDIPTRHISASRWAGDANSPGEEGEISDDETARKWRKKMPSSEFLDTRRNNNLSTPEAGVGAREVSDVAKGRSSDSDGSLPSRPSSGDRGLQNQDMEVDNRYDDTDSSLSPRKTDSEDEDYSHGTPEPPSAPKRTVNMLQGCRSVDEFERLNKIDEGTYGVVYRAKDKKTGEIVALKKVKMEKEREGFPLTSLREINILLSLHHPSIVDVKEVVVGSNLDSIFMVMEYMEHDLKGLMETMKQPFSQSEVKCLMLQLLDGIKYLHDNWVLHRDLKTSNLLLNNQGDMKICDFGLARQYGSPLKPYTHLVVTLWYRSPELLLGAKEYSTAIDMWSLGCIMAELLSKEPLFNGKSEFDQLDKIFRILGTPNETIWPGFSKLPGVKVNFVKHQLPALGDSGLAFWPHWYNQLRKKFPATSFTGSPVLSDAGFDLLNRLLTYDPEKRITADAALKHEWFREVPLPKSKEFMPTFPAQHAQDRRLRRVLKSPDPLEEQRRKELQQAELGTGGLFG
ncbi:Cyclin-dependent kinase G-2 [Bienertia sinuspersici]